MVLGLLPTYYLLIFPAFTTSVAVVAPPLVSLVPGEGPRAPPPCCRAPGVLSCRPAMVNSSLVTSMAAITFPSTGQLFTFTNHVPPSGYHYTSAEGDEAVVTVSSATGHVFGTMKAQGRAFTLEHCTSGPHWIEYKVDTFLTEEEEGMEEEGDGPLAEDILEDDDLGAVAEFSIMIYYTPQFAEITSDIPGFVEQVLAETNQGYVNSQVALVARLHCIEQAAISDTDSSTKTMVNFLKMRAGSTSSLRHTADTAVLLVASLGASCGRALAINSIASGKTVSVCAKSCALGYFTFGHELAHSFGAYHNRETGHLNPYYPYGQGHLLAQGNASTGVRSILAYYAAGHAVRVNHYSNPDAIYPATATPTGTKDNNNAKVLRKNRWKLAKVGDESACCGCKYAPPPGSTLLSVVIMKLVKLKAAIKNLLWPF